MVSKKRGIAKKPTDQAAAEWVAAGGIDPELKLSDIQTSKQVDTQASKQSDIQTAKSKNTAYVRTTLYLPSELHTRLKVASVGRTDGLDMSDIAAVALKAWLDADN